MTNEVQAAVVGAAIAFVAAIVVLVATLCHAASQAAKQRAHEANRQDLVELRNAYIDWLGAAHRAHNRLQSLKSADAQQQPSLLAEPEDGRDTFFAWRLVVLEPEPRMARKVRAVIKMYDDCMKAFAQGASADRSDRLVALFTKALYALRKVLNKRYGRDESLPGAG